MIDHRDPCCILPRNYSLYIDSKKYPPMEAPTRRRLLQEQMLDPSLESSTSHFLLCIAPPKAVASASWVGVKSHSSTQHLMVERHQMYSALLSGIHKGARE